MKVGSTGSRSGTTTSQLHELMGFLRTNDVEEFHHGCCVGADTFAHYAAVRCGLPIVYHPPTDMSQASDLREFPGEWRKPAPYLERNRAIVDETDMLVAMPRGPRPASLRDSGTWYTVEYAVRQSKPVRVIFDGPTVEILC